MGRSERAPNARLLALIREAGWTYGATARAVCQVAAENGQRGLRTNASAVSHWVGGTRPSASTARFLAEALSRKLRRPLHLHELGLPSSRSPSGEGEFLPPDPVAAIARLGKADLDRRTFLASSVYAISALALPLSYSREIAQRGAHARSRTATIGDGEVSAVRDVTTIFTRADELLGGGHGRSAVVEYLSTNVATYCSATFAHEADRRAMFGAAAELAYLVGWKAHDEGLAGLAQRYYLHSFQLAHESDPAAHTGYVLRILAHQALDLGRREYCIDLADAALSRARGHVDAETESLFWLTLARAQAANRSPRRAIAALDRAETLLTRAGADQPPNWASLGGPPEARLASHSGKALTCLGDLPAAEKQFRRSAACWDAATHPRIHALTLAELAEVQCDQGKVDEACATWSAALDGMAGIRSARTRDSIDSMRRRIAVFRGRGLVAARRLDARAAALKASGA